MHPSASVGKKIHFDYEINVSTGTSRLARTAERTTRETEIPSSDHCNVKFDASTNNEAFSNSFHL